jgi:phosphoribosyl 1,2-cyclic phosphodiesterase
MKFEQLYSSSKGNLYMLTSDKGMRLMIECGVKWKKLQEALNYDLKNIVGCLISHEHNDHSIACKEVLEAGIDVFSSLGTLEALGIEKHRRSFSDFHYLGSRGFHVVAYRTTHDAVDPLLYVIRCDDKTMLFATDTSHINQTFAALRFNIIAIECSYDKTILLNKVDAGKINEELAKRLLTSHMEVSETKRYLKQNCNLSECTEIHLLHMSGDNMVAKKVREEFEGKFYIDVKTVG